MEPSLLDSTVAWLPIVISPSCHRLAFSSSSDFLLVRVKLHMLCKIPTIGTGVGQRARRTIISDSSAGFLGSLGAPVAADLRCSRCGLKYHLHFSRPAIFTSQRKDNSRHPSFQTTMEGKDIVGICYLPMVLVGATVLALFVYLSFKRNRKKGRVQDGLINDEGSQFIMK